jgi:hypothetical protein
MPGASPATHDTQGSGAYLNSLRDLARGGTATNDFRDRIGAFQISLAIADVITT